MKKIILAAIILVILGGLAFWIIDKTNRTNLSPINTDTATGTNKYTDIQPNLDDFKFNLSSDPKDVAWKVFQKYLSYNQYYNLNGVKSVVYKVAPICNTDKPSKECASRMFAAYSYGAELKKEDFKNVWNDKKQIILSTNFEDINEGDIIQRKRAMIFFIIDENNQVKLLSFNPIKGAIISKGEASDEELNARIQIYTADKDNDGQFDYDEECLDLNKSEGCVKTNPEIRDTDQDGWWDSTDALLGNN